MANEIIPLINGIAYEWASIRVNLFGGIVYGITGINYEEKQDMENIYGAGNLPVERGYGNISFSSGISLLASEVEAITANAPGKRIQAIPEFDIVVAYLVGTTVVTHTLKQCRFTTNKRDVKQGDKKIEVAIELIVGNIKW
ncbi:hypothetical protein SDC9_46848 [bioreactor metagenome]|uniref:Uncharacterized protein n=1 Tax=bioreactor metagenome TaxID=1076179 RepID=A0A644WAW9_9ZZZZ